MNKKYPSKFCADFLHGFPRHTERNQIQSNGYSNKRDRSQNIVQKKVIIAGDHMKHGHKNIQCNENGGNFPDSFLCYPILVFREKYKSQKSIYAIYEIEQDYLAETECFFEKSQEKIQRTCLEMGNRFHKIQNQQNKTGNE